VVTYVSYKTDGRFVSVKVSDPLAGKEIVKKLMKTRGITAKVNTTEIRVSV